MKDVLILSYIAVRARSVVVVRDKLCAYSVLLGLQQGAGALCVAGRGSDDEDKGKDDLKVLLKIAKDTLFGVSGTLLNVGALSSQPTMIPPGARFGARCTHISTRLCSGASSRNAMSAWPHVDQDLTCRIRF